VKARIILFLLPLLALLVATAAKTSLATNGATATIAHVAASPGEVVNVPVTVSGFQNFAALQLWITFNGEVLAFEALQNIHPSLSTGGSFLYNLSEGIIKLSWYNQDIEGASIPDGDKLFDLRFTFCTDALACALNDNASPVYFIEERSFMADPVYNRIPLSLYNGSVYSTVVQRVLSVSWDGDGMVTVGGSPYTEPLLVADGALLSLDAVATGNWTFAGWSGALSGATTPQSLLMDSNKEVTATFEDGGDDVPENLHLTNTIIQGGEQVCYNARETITVAGNGTTFTVEGGGSALLIAGKNIVMLPGTSVEAGGYLLATIGQEFCDTRPDPGKTMAEAAWASHEEEKTIQEHHEYHEYDGVTLRVYPNPTRGIVTIELTGEAGPPALSVPPGTGSAGHTGSDPGSFDVAGGSNAGSGRNRGNDTGFGLTGGNDTGTGRDGLWGGRHDPAGVDRDGAVRIEVYNLLGHRVIAQVVPPGSRTQVDLTGHPPGIYIVRVLQGSTSAEKRLIKTF